jgi:hypothetical protein
MKSTCLLITIALLAACGGAPPQAEAHPDHPVAEVVPGRVELSAIARENLGITFAKAEYRVVQGVLRLPGRFAAAPGSRRIYQAPLDGRVEVLVKPYQQVQPGEVLFRIMSPRWHQLRLELAEGSADAGATLAAQRLAAGEEQSAATARALSAWKERLATLERLDREIGGKAAERSEAATRIADLSLQAVEANARVARLRRDAVGPDGTVETGLAAVRLRQMLAEAASITGFSPAELVALDEQRRPRWSAIEAPEVRATAPGVVEGEVAGANAWVDAHAAVLTVTDPAGVRLHAAGLQADLPRLRDGLPARIVAYDPADRTAIPATVVLGPVADAIDRSVELIAHPATGSALPAWVRPGVTALLEIAVRGSAEEELAIPLAATVPDGLVSVFFRRDAKSPDAVQRVEADLGISDGRWVVVNSGLKEGDEVVLGGVHPLKLSVQAPVAGAAKPDPHASCGGH